MKIGYRIKDLRTRQRITLKQLARKTGLTTSFLSQLERDLTSPSINSLEKIAEAMGMKVGYFFEDEDRKELIFVKRCVDQDKNTVGKEKKVFCETLASGFLNIKMHPQIFTMAVGSELVKELDFASKEKFGIVLDGKVELLCNLEENNSFLPRSQRYCFQRLFLHAKLLLPKKSPLLKL